MGGPTRVEVVGREVEETRAALASALRAVEERGERLEGLVERAEALGEDSGRFAKASAALKRQSCRRGLGWTAVVAGVLGGLLCLAALGLLAPSLLHHQPPATADQLTQHHYPTHATHLA